MHKMNVIEEAIKIAQKTGITPIIWEGKYNYDSLDSAFLSQFCHLFLDNKESYPSSNTIRSWYMVSRVIEACDGQNFSQEAKSKVIAGIVGCDTERKIDYNNYPRGFKAANTLFAAQVAK